MSQTPEHDESAEPTHEVRETEVTESDPNADSADGLAGGMGVSSERRGVVRGGTEEVTYAAAPTHTDAGTDGAPTGEDTPPEQSSRE